MKKGAFILVLHSHLPYVRKKGRWPHGEEILFEAMAETYIPLLNMLNDLIKEGYHPRLTISLTPILLEQLDDKYLKTEFVSYLKERIQAAKNDSKKYKLNKTQKNNSLTDYQLSRIKHNYDLAKYYIDWYTNILNSFRRTYKKDLIGAFKLLQDQGYLDIVTSSATHAYLPLYYNEDAIKEQLNIGIKTYKKHFGKNPRGIWLPECGYRPYKKSNKGNLLKGFEKFLDEYKVKYFFTDSHVFSTPVTIKMFDGGMNLNPTGFSYLYNDLLPKTVAEINYSVREYTPKETYKPYKVYESNVSVFARDRLTSLQVWSSDFGYPGDYFYREFHSKDSETKLQYCRITHREGLDNKELYDPAEAHRKVIEHADHFVNIVENRVKEINAETGEYASIVSSYDSELFGHWWFEGVDWLKEVLRRMEDSDIVDLSNADEFILSQPPSEKINIPESSWGLGGSHYIWNNDETTWIWPIIHDLSAQMIKASKDFEDAKRDKKILLDQAVRELLLLQSSDWPFLVSTGQARDYAIERFNEHVNRFKKFMMYIYSKKVLTKEDREYIKKIREEDNPFDFLDYKDLLKLETELPFNKNLFAL